MRLCPSSAARSHPPGCEDRCSRGCQGRDAPHTRHGAGPGHDAVTLPRAVGVGTGQFRQPADSGSCTTFLPPRSSRCESRLQQLPDLAHTGGPGAPARPCPSRNTGRPRTLSPARSAGWKGKEGAGQDRQVLLLCTSPGSRRRGALRLRLFVDLSGGASAAGCRTPWDLARCVNTVTTGEMFSLRWHLPKFSCS